MNPNPSLLINRILSKNNLDCVSGNPLYSYVLSNADYLLCEVSLKEHFRNKEERSAWSALFVLYASVWWRKEYNGSNWSWEPITTKLQCESLRKTSAFYTVITDGFKYWKRRLLTSNDSGSTRYLGSIFAEAGLPNCSFANDHFMSIIIKESYQLLLKTRAMEDDFNDQITHIANKRLPSTLAEDSAVLDIIKQTVWCFYYLAKKHPLAEQSEPVKYLNTTDPDWRSTFPISADLESGTPFIDSLLSDVAKEPLPKVKSPKIVHYISKEGDELSLSSIFQYPDFSKSKVNKIPCISLGLSPELFLNTSNSFNFILENSNGFMQNLCYAFRTNDNQLRFTNSSAEVKLPEGTEKQTWKLSLRDEQTGTSITVPLINADAIDDQNPWLFTPKGEGNWVYQSDCSCSVTAKEAIVALPEQPSSNVEGEVTEYGYLGKTQRVISIKSNLYLDIQGDQFRFRLNSVSETKGNFSLSGDEFSFSRFQQFDCFHGMPKVYYKDESGFPLSMSKYQLQFRTVGSNNWSQITTNTNNYFGRIWLRAINESGDLLFRKQMIIVPTTFKVQIISEKEIQLQGSQNLKLSILSEQDLDVVILKKEYGHSILFENSNSISNERLDLLFQTDDNEKIKLTAPVPKDTFALYKNGILQSRRADLFYEELDGYRLSFFNNSDKSINQSYDLELIDARSKESALVKTRKQKVESFSFAQKSLIDLKPLIDKLFCLGSLDSTVSIKCGNHAATIHRFTIPCEFDREERRLRIETVMDDKSTIEVNALRVDAPLSLENKISLDYSLEKDAWIFPDNLVGNWILFPAEQSSVYFRAALAPYAEEYIEEDISLEEKFYAISRIKQAWAREKEYQAIFEKLALNCTHPIWKQLKFLWEETTHLPLQIFDVWSGLAKSNKGKIAAFISFDQQILQRFSESFGILWETASVDDFVEVLTSFRDIQLSAIDSNTQKIILGNTINRVHEELHLYFVANKLKVCFNINATEPSPPLFFLEGMLMASINGEENNPGLIGKNDSIDWPTLAQATIRKQFKKLPKEVRSLFPKGLPGYAKPVVYLPAILASISIFGHGTLFQTTRLRYDVEEIINFDREFFTQYFTFFQGALYENKEKLSFEIEE